VEEAEPEYPRENKPVHGRGFGDRDFFCYV